VNSTLEVPRVLPAVGELIAAGVLVWL